jgi:SAM-dependent methyltransferase
MNNHSSLFLEVLQKNYQENTLLRVLFSKTTSKDSELMRVTVRPVAIKNITKLSFLYHYKTQDITKNYTLEEALGEMENLIGSRFKNIIACTAEQDIHLTYNKKLESQLQYLKARSPKKSPENHDREKTRLIETDNNIYLQELWVMTRDNKVIGNKQSKLKQIHRYIETFQTLLENSPLNDKQDIHIVDMGCWKGYLSFALYDFLIHHGYKNIRLTGIDMRQWLVDTCNGIAKKCQFEWLKFIAGNIAQTQIDRIDILIALHACDTATDDAIVKWIESHADLIITAPCCHKQIRKELDPNSQLSPIVNYGILKERQSELVTDTLRALVLESHGYNTKIFEFIADAHTHKNVMITGSKKTSWDINTDALTQIDELKKAFGIEYFYLEDILS